MSPASWAGFITGFLTLTSEKVSAWSELQKVSFLTQSPALKSTKLSGKSFSLLVEEFRTFA